MYRLTPALLILAGLAVSPAHAQSAEGATNAGLGAEVTVNGQTISRNHVQLMLTSINPNPSVRGAGGEDARIAARQELVTQELLAQEARRIGLDKNPVIADQLSFQTRAILSRAYLQDYYEKNPVTEESLKSAYEWRRANGKIQEYRIRQILLGTQAEAADVIAKLAKGEDFADLAKRRTQDPGGQNNAGDLGWFRTDIFVDHHFTDAVESLKKGEYTRTPVRTRFGWHVIKLEDAPRRVAQAESYDQLDDASKEAIRQKTVQLRIESLTAELAKKAKLGGPAASNVAKLAK